MDYYAIVGMVALAFVALFGFLVSIKTSIKKSIDEERKPIEDLNMNVVRLNMNFDYMRERDEIRDQRINKHGVEIDTMREKQRANEKALAQLEMRVGTLEKEIGR